MNSIFQSIRQRLEHAETQHNDIGTAATTHLTPSRGNGPLATGHKITLLELFQSQSCDSCPPTNANLIDLTAEQSASASSYLLLTYHVTYWNHLNWVDTFSDDSFDLRQRDYVRKIKNSQGVYTPMLVVNGRSVGIGNTRGEVNRLIAEGEQGSNDHSRVEITSTEQNEGEGGLVVTVDATTVTSTLNTVQLEVLVVSYIPSPEDVFVARGENAGRILPHRNVVTEVMRIGYLGRGSVGKYVLPVITGDSTQKGRALLVQDGRGGQILGVAVL